MTRILVRAPCKINLDLKIGSKRIDGFHDINSIFVALELSDELEIIIEDNPGGETLETDLNELPTELARPLSNLKFEKNLAIKAARAFKSEFGMDKEIHIRLKKRVPAESGLGGGSSDAAAVLKALSGTRPCPPETITKLAATLGSDVPFFLCTNDNINAARARGRGEILEPFTGTAFYFVIVRPDLPGNTARAFQILDRWRESGGIPVEGPYRNDFLPALLEAGTFKEKQIYREVLVSLRDSGAEYASLSGSGAACFGLYPNENAAQNAARALCGKWPYVRYTRTLRSRIK